MAQKYSAVDGWSTWQKIVLSFIVLFFVSAEVLAPFSIFEWGTICLSLLCLVIVLVKSTAVAAGYLGNHTIHIEDSELAGLDENELPLYSVLVPLYKEAQVVAALIEAMNLLDYPKSKLDILFLLEADDSETQAEFARHDAAVRALGARVVVVPAGTPKTKPRACNHGLALARGEFLVVFDAEDRPEQDQLKKAIVAFTKLGPKTVCLQAKLNYFNFSQNLLTRLFTLEYTAWFDLYLPGLHAVGAPIPLGGTSNHLRTQILRDLGGWDSYNVTEDCDLGIRLDRASWDTRILDSTTWEEACSRLKPWLQQRSRWVKGYLQTFLVHTRQPTETLRDLGLKKTLLMSLTVGGLVLSLVLMLPSVGMFAIWLYSYLHDPFWATGRLTGSLSITLAAFLGYFVFIHILGAYHRRKLSLIPFTLVLPFYWVMMSAGAIRGVIQFFHKPFLWEKTPHGLTAIAKVDPEPEIPKIGDALVVGGAPIAVRSESVVLATMRQKPLRRRRRRLKAAIAGSVAAGLALLPYVFYRAGLGGAAMVEVPVEQAWTGHQGVTFEIRVHSTDDDAKHLNPAIMAYVKVLDGDWYQLNLPPLTRDGDIIKYSVRFDQPWLGVGHLRPWGPWCLRRIREFGVQVFGKVEDSDYSLEIAKITPWGDQAPVPAKFSVDEPFPPQLESKRVYETTFRINREWANPFDPTQVDLWASIETPAGTTLHVPAFYSQDYTRTANKGREVLTAKGNFFWAVRFATATPGHYRWFLEGKDRSGTLGRTAMAEFDVEATRRPGYVRLDSTAKRFAVDDKPFFPIGINISSPGDVRAVPNYDFAIPGNSEGAFRMESYLRLMKESGISVGRVWFSPWSGGLEWRKQDEGFQGAGQYNLQNAWRMDRILRTAEDLGIYVDLLLYPHGPFQATYIKPWGKLIDSQWFQNPYNQQNGGPLATPDQFLTNPEARRGSRNYIRYVMARYGAFTSVFGWVLWNEVDTVTSDMDAVADWHRDMTKVVRENDLGAHLLSTEFRKFGSPGVWSLPGIDYTQVESYADTAFGHGEGLTGRFDERLQNLGVFGKPVVLEEYGGSWWGGTLDLLAQNIHDGLWLAWMKSMPSTGLAWWWNLVFEKKLTIYYRVFADFVKGEDLSGRTWSEQKPTIKGTTVLKSRTLQSTDAAYGWVYNEAITDRLDPIPKRAAEMVGAKLLLKDTFKKTPFSETLINPELPLFAAVIGASLELHDLADGDYVLELWDTWAQRPPRTSTVTIRGGLAQILLPTMTRDLAFKLKRQ